MKKLSNLLEKFGLGNLVARRETDGCMQIELEVPIKTKYRILVVDDEAGPREALRMILKEKYNVVTAGDADEAIAKIAEGEFDVVSLDIRMPDVNGLQLLRKVKVVQPETEVLIITGFPNVENAVEALRFGAYDYIVKPFDMKRVEQAIKKGILRRTQNLLTRDLVNSLADNEVGENA
jgi:DNA-binding NtrC family response regulator